MFLRDGRTAPWRKKTRACARACVGACAWMAGCERLRGAGAPLLAVELGASRRFVPRSLGPRSRMRTGAPRGHPQRRRTCRVDSTTTRALTCRLPRINCPSELQTTPPAQVSCPPAPPPSACLWRQAGKGCRAPSLPHTRARAGTSAGRACSRATKPGTLLRPQCGAAIRRPPGHANCAKGSCKSRAPNLKTEKASLLWDSNPRPPAY